MKIRSLPLQFEPIEGEAIDSYVEAYAARLGATFGDFENAVGLDRTGSYRRRYFIQLSEDELRNVTAATGVPPDSLRRMTLSYFDGRCVGINPSRRSLRAGFPWGFAGSSKFCPECLNSSGGRWSLIWRLGWSFACLRHCCLLAHQCPECAQPQRINAHLEFRVPRPGRCANVAPGVRGRSRGQCGAPLGFAAVLPLGDDHPAIAAQRAVYRIIDSAIPVRGIYSDSAYSPVEILFDIRNLACEALGNVDGAGRAGLVPNDLLAAVRNRNEDRRARGIARARPEIRARSETVQTPPDDTLDTAIAVTAAWTCLAKSELLQAAAAIRPIVTKEVYSEKPPVPQQFLDDNRITHTLASAYIGALGPYLAPLEQLRHRTHTHPIPVVPRSFQGSADFDRRIPTLLWETWSLRMPPLPNEYRSIRTVLAIAVALCGSRVSYGDVLKRLNVAQNQHTFDRIINALSISDWEAIATAIERLSEYLDAYRPPIDYRRRRGLNYAELLPPQVWSRICRQHQLSRLERCADAARFLLVEQLSAQPIVSWAQSLQVDRILRWRTSALAEAIDQHCYDFLTTQGVTDEPLTWEPSPDLIADLDLPGTDPGQVDINALHILMRWAGCSVNEAAQRLAVSPEVIRYCLVQHPASKQDGK